jgi:hypothetical protein
MSENDGYNSGDRYESRIQNILQNHGVLKPNFQRAGASFLISSSSEISL